MMPATLAIIRHVFDDDRERAPGVRHLGGDRLRWCSLRAGGRRCAARTLLVGLGVHHQCAHRPARFGSRLALGANQARQSRAAVRPARLAVDHGRPGRPDAGHQGSRQGRLLAPASRCGGNRGSDLQPGVPATSAASDDSHDRLHPVPRPQFFCRCGHRAHRFRCTDGYGTGGQPASATDGRPVAPAGGSDHPANPLGAFIAGPLAGWHCRAWAPNAFSVHHWASPQPEPCSTCWATAPRTGFSWSRSPCSVSASVRQ